MVRDRKQKWINWAYSVDSIRVVALCGQRVNKAAVQYPLDSYEWYLGLTQGWQKGFSFDWEEAMGEKLVQSSLLQINPFTFRLLFQDGCRFNVYLMELEALQKQLAEESLKEIVLDKDNFFGTQPAATDLSHRTRKPEAGQYRVWVSRFFSAMNDMAVCLLKGELISAQLSLEKARKPLLQMVKAACSARSGYSIYLGDQGENLKTYLPADWYQRLCMTYPAVDEKSLWTALFQACLLFRRAGLELNKDPDFHYPKRMDVEMMQMFRSYWEEKNGSFRK